MQTDLTGDRIDDTVDLRQLLSMLWQGRWWIVTATVVSGIVAVAYALLAPVTYRAEAVVQVRQENSGGGLSSLASRYGDLAALAGLGGGTGGDRALALATLKSRVVIQAFIAENNLLPILFEKAWDSNNSRWKSETPPTLWHGYKAFSEQLLKVSEDRKTSLVVIAIEWRDPEIAAAWVTELIARTNAYLRNKTIHEGQNNLDYLRNQAKQTSVVELQQAVYALMESELKKLMFASGSDEYIIQTIDPAQAPKLRIKPKRRQIVVAGLLLGGFLGVIALLLRGFFVPRPVAERARSS